MKPKNRIFNLPAAFVIATLAATGASHAAKTWSGTTDGLWATTTNWVEGALPGTTETLVLDSNSVSNLSITLGANRTIRGIDLSTPANNVTFTGNTLTIASNGINMAAANKNLTVTSGVAVQSAIHSWNVASGTTLTTPVPARNGGANNDNIGGHIVVSGAGTVKMGAAAIGIIADNGPNPYVSIASTEDWAGTDATGTVIPVTYTTDAFTGNANIVTSNTYTTNGAAPTSVRFNNTTGPVTVNNSNTSTYRGIIMTSGADNVTINGGNIRPNRTLTGGASFSIIQNSTTKDLTIGSSLAVASSNTPVSLVKGGPGRVIFTGGYFGGAGRIFIHQGTAQYGNGGTTGDPGTTASSIINNASLVFNRSNALTVITNISGSGSLTQDGSGELAFTTSVSTFTGPVNINAGTLSATTLANLGSGTAININGGTFKFSGAFDPSARTITIGASGATFNTGTQNISFASAVGNSGSGNFTKAGTGSLTLTQPAGWTGATNIDGGTLFVTNTTGSATNGAVTIGAAGGLGGTGTVAGAVTTTSGSIITPGTSGVSTLNVGSLTLESGSITNLEFGTGNDQINVSDSDGLILNGGTINLYQEGTGFTTPFAGTPGTYNLFQYSGTLGGSIGNLSVGNPQPGKSYVFGTSGGFVTLTIANTGVTRNWITDGSGGWDIEANWNGTVPDASQSVVNFITALTTAPATISLNGSKTVGNMVFTSATYGYTIDAGSGGSLTLSNGGSNATINVNAGAHTIATPINLNNSVDISLPLTGRSLTLSGIISGTGLGITKTGLGNLNLTAANTFSGDISLTGGSTTFAPSGLGTGNLFLDGVKLVWDGTNTEDLTSGSRTVSMIDNVVTFDTNGNDVLIANSIGENGSASLVKLGGGKLTLAADNTFSGSLTISNGELALGDGGASGSVLGAIVNNTQMTINRSDTATIASAISGTGTLEKVGTNEVILTGNNSFTGDTFLTAGTLTISNTNALLGSKLDYTSGTLQFGTVTAATIGGLTGSIDLPLVNASAAGVALTIGGANGSGEYSGKFSGAGSLTKAGTGTLILSNDNTYTGATGMNNAGGTIDLTTGGKIATTALNTGTGTRFMITGGDLTSSAQSTISAEGFSATSGFNLISGTAAFNGGIRTGTNDGSLISISGGTFTATSVSLQRTQNYQGFAAGPSSSAATYVEASASNATGFVVSGGTVTLSGALNVGTSNSSASALFSGGTTAVAGVVTVGNTANTRWNLMEVSGGNFSANDATSGIVLSPHPTVAALSMLKVTGGVATAKRISLGTATSAAGTGVVWVKGGTLYVGAGGIVQDAATFTSRLTLTTGTLGADDTWSTSLPAALDGAFTLKAANEANTAKDITLGGALTGAGSLTKTGGGVVTLNGVNNYTGATSVNEGTLSLSNDDVLSDTALVNVATGATLNLNHAGTDTVLNFQINGVDQGSGTFGGTGSGADHIVPEITGSGKLYVIPTDPFIPWIAGFGLTGSDALPESDPDNDGQNNLLEFALNGIPNSGASSGKVRSSVELVAGDNALTYTLPVRTGAVFSGAAAQTTTIDGLTYTIEGSDDLSIWNTTVISEVVPALSAGLPTLDTGWTYRTFRTPGSSTSDPADFIRSKVHN